MTGWHFAFVERPVPRLREGRCERHHNDEQHNCENEQADVLRHVSKSRVYPRVSKGIDAFSKDDAYPTSTLQSHNDIHAIQRISECNSHNNIIM